MAGKKKETVATEVVAETAAAPKKEAKAKKEKVAKTEEVKTAPVAKPVVEEVVEEKSAPAVETKGDEKWGILHIYSSYNNTHLHVTDVTGSETIAKISGGMVTKSDRLKSSPNVAMTAAKQLSEACLSKGVNALYVKLRAVGGHNGPTTPGPGSQAAIRMLTRYGIKLGRIEDVTPIPHDTCRKSGGKRGRRV